MDATNTALEKTDQLDHCNMFGLKKCKKNKGERYKKNCEAS